MRSIEQQGLEARDNQRELQTQSLERSSDRFFDEVYAAERFLHPPQQSKTQLAGLQFNTNNLFQKLDSFGNGTRARAPENLYAAARPEVAQPESLQRQEIARQYPAKQVVVRPEPASRSELKERADVDARPEFQKRRYVIAETQKALCSRFDVLSDALDRKEGPCFDGRLFSEHFSRAAKEFEREAGKRGLSSNEILETYKQVDRLLDSKTSYRISDQRYRLQLAIEVLQHAAAPRDISQGSYNTCNVTTVEVKVFWKKPSEAARLVADLAQTGTYRAPEGTCVTLDAECLKPHEKARMYPHYDGDRSFATQLFNVAAANLAYIKDKAPYRYVQKQPEIRKSSTSSIERGGWAPMDDLPERDPSNGECLYWINKGKLEKVAEMPQLTGDQIGLAATVFLGGKISDHILMHADYHDRCRPYWHDKASGSFKSEAELAAKLTDLKARGQLPVILGVDTAFEPFPADTADPHSEGLHVVSVFAFDEATRGAKFDNQWKKSADHLQEAVPLRQLYLATRADGKGFEDLENSIAADRAAGKRNVVKELEALCHDKTEDGPVDASVLVPVIREAVQLRAAQQGPGQGPDYSEWRAVLETSLRLLPLSQRFELLAEMNDGTVLRYKDFNRLAASFGMELTLRRFGEIDHELNKALTKLSLLLTKMLPAQSAQIRKLMHQGRF